MGSFDIKMTFKMRVATKTTASRRLHATIYVSKQSEVW